MEKRESNFEKNLNESMEGNQKQSSFTHKQHKKKHKYNHKPKHERMESQNKPEHERMESQNKENHIKHHSTYKSPEDNSIKNASENAKRRLSDALSKKANSTVSITKEGEGWNAVVEIIDEEFLPDMNVKSMNDIIGIYEVKLSKSGDLMGWTKVNSKRRGG
jgi:hypothetical protein